MNLFEELPNELVIKVMASLGLCDLFRRVQFVSQRFHVLIPLALPSLDLAPGTYPGPHLGSHRREQEEEPFLNYRICAPKEFPLFQAVDRHLVRRLAVDFAATEEFFTYDDFAALVNMFPNLTEFVYNGHIFGIGNTALDQYDATVNPLFKLSNLELFHLTTSSYESFPVCNFSRLRSLAISTRSGTLSQQAIEKLYEISGNIEELSLPNCFNLDYNRFTNLRSLSLKVLSDGAGEVLSSFPGKFLKHLKIETVSDYEYNVTTLSNSIQSSLEHLEMRGHCIIHEDSLANLKLKHFAFTSWMVDTDFSFFHHFQSQPFLESLHFETQFSERNAFDILTTPFFAVSLGNLKKLHLVLDALKFSHFFAQQISQHCTRLESIAVTFLLLDSRMSLFPLSRSLYLSPCLTRLILDGFKIFNSNLIEIIQNCPLVVHLKLSEIQDELDDATFDALADLRHLERLEVGGVVKYWPYVHSEEFHESQSNLSEISFWGTLSKMKLLRILECEGIIDCPEEARFYQVLPLLEQLGYCGKNRYHS